MPLLDTNQEMGRFDRQWQLASKYDPFGKRLLGRCQLNSLEILFRFLNPMESHPLHMSKYTAFAFKPDPSNYENNPEGYPSC